MSPTNCAQKLESELELAESWEVLPFADLKILLWLSGQKLEWLGEASRTFIFCNIFSLVELSISRQIIFWGALNNNKSSLIVTRISRAAPPPGCDPVRSPMCGCTPTVDSAVTSQMWIDIEFVSQYFGCKPHWACTNSRRSESDHQTWC